MRPPPAPQGMGYRSFHPGRLGERVGYAKIHSRSCPSSATRAGGCRRSRWRCSTSWNIARPGSTSCGKARQSWHGTDTPSSSAISDPGSPTSLSNWPWLSPGHSEGLGAWLLTRHTFRSGQYDNTLFADRGDSGDMGQLGGLLVGQKLVIRIDRSSWTHHTSACA